MAAVGAAGGEDSSCLLPGLMPHWTGGIGGFLPPCMKHGFVLLTLQLDYLWNTDLRMDPLWDRAVAYIALYHNLIASQRFLQHEEESLGAVQSLSVDFRHFLSFRTPSQSRQRAVQKAIAKA